MITCICYDSRYEIHKTKTRQKYAACSNCHIAAGAFTALVTTVSSTRIDFVGPADTGVAAAVAVSHPCANMIVTAITYASYKTRL